MRQGCVVDSAELSTSKVALECQKQFRANWQQLPALHSLLLLAYTTLR